MTGNRVLLEWRKRTWQERKLDPEDAPTTLRLVMFSSRGLPLAIVEALFLKACKRCDFPLRWFT